MKSLRKTILFGMLFAMACTGCASNSENADKNNIENSNKEVTVAYHREGELPMVKAMTGASTDLQVKTEETMTLYAKEDNASKLSYEVKYTPATEASEEDMEILEKFIKSDYTSTMKTSTVATKVDNGSVVLTLTCDFATCTDDLSRIQLNSEDIKDGQYPMNQLDKLLKDAGYTKA